MIESIRLKGFSRHRDETFQFGPGVTVFVGPSGSGKTAILRALRWVCVNKPQGHSFVGEWRTLPAAFVSLKVDGHTISRKKGDEVNWYKLDGKVLKAFGTDPPDLVSDLINVGAVNFQFQHDGPYWFTLSPQQVSKNLNQVINLSTIDRVLANASKRVKRCRVEIDITKERLATARTDARKYQWAVEAKRDVNKFTRLLDDLATVATESSRIASAVAVMVNVTDTHRNASDAILDAANAVRLSQRIAKLAERESELQAGGDKLSPLVNKVALPSIARLKQLRADVKRLTERERACSSYILGAEILEGEIRSCQRQIKLTRESMKKVSGKRCPACGQAIKKQ